MFPKMLWIYNTVKELTDVSRAQRKMFVV